MSDKKTDPGVEKKTLTLDDADIVSERSGAEEPAPVSRRSMLGVIGVLAGGAAAAVLPGCVVRRRPVVYAQPPQPVVYAQAPQPATVVVQAPQGRYRTGVTDSDGGAYADPAGYGRGTRRQAYTGLTDSDGGAYADPAGYGRGVYGRTSGITDSDGGPYADPAGNGRGTGRVGTTGITDSDGGPYADPAGQGRGRWR
ncbi:hypothetical protein [Sandaracinus amylolyticus]|uniref:hypothetical protein n=1 Tax=Sandaracinus amylolyticus TaxID=927083 RepID=UPI001F19B5F7|nr:hypothetical protein [Sandaracinus amylolyticus]UJR84843.1 Hypothetical protein I5071_69220 [Sandaracinus amylolyticus]